MNKVIYNWYTKKIVIAFLWVLLCGTVSCTKNFTAVNTDPNKILAKDLNGQLLGQAFAESQYAGMFGKYGPWQEAQNLYGDLYAQYFATIASYFASDQYREIGRWSDDAWTYFYRTAAPQLHFVIQFTQEHNMPVEHAIAEIWKVEVYHRITDYWGPVIYTNFGNEKTSVAYDAQKDIYMDFFKTLDEAVSVLKQHSGEVSVFSNNDLVYNGSVDKWLAFANSLRLRLAVRIAYVEPEIAKKEAEKAAGDGVMTDNTGNAGVTTTDITQNPHGHIILWDEFRMSASMQSILTGYNDPRLSVYFSEAAGGGYKGVRNGLPVADRTSVLKDYSKMGKMYFLPQQGGSNPPIRVMSAAEVYFLRAEGALRGWNMQGDAGDLYDEGIRMSLEERTNASPATISDYINSTKRPVSINDKWHTPAMTDIPVKFESNADFETKLEQIITQKWLAIYPDGWEAWAERRRTGYPKGYPLIESLNPNVPADKMMRRLKFVKTEIDNNLEAVEAARKMLKGPDMNTTKLWWDAKP